MLTQEETMAIQGTDISDDYLSHYGILGMKWGIRRYQNKDGSLTNAGKEHYGLGKVFKKREPKTDAEIKAAIMKKPTVHKVKKYQHLFTTEELNDISKRQASISSIKVNQRKTAALSTESFGNFGKNLTTFAGVLATSAALVVTVHEGKKIVDALKGKPSPSSEEAAKSEAIFSILAGIGKK